MVSLKGGYTVIDLKGIKTSYSSHKKLDDGETFQKLENIKGKPVQLINAYFEPDDITFNCLIVSNVQKVENSIQCYISGTYQAVFYEDGTFFVDEI